MVWRVFLVFPVEFRKLRHQRPMAFDNLSEKVCGDRIEGKCVWCLSYRNSNTCIISAGRRLCSKVSQQRFPYACHLREGAWKLSATWFVPVHESSHHVCNETQASSIDKEAVPRLDTCQRPITFQLYRNPMHCGSRKLGIVQWSIGKRSLSGRQVTEGGI